MRFSRFRQRHPAFLVAFFIIIATFLSLDGWLLYKRDHYAAEIQRLRAGMSDFERKRSDAITNTQARQFEMMMALLRRQAKLDKEIHLSVSVDSGTMYLEQEGALLRQIAVEVGPEKRIGTPPDTVRLAIPRGTRTVQRILSDSDAWTVPGWVYTDRQLPEPSNHNVRGALGPVAIVLDGGAVIYSLPASGPLNDSAYVMPGSVRARAEDLRAVVPNLQRGTPVYFY